MALPMLDDVKNLKLVTWEQHLSSDIIIFLDVELTCWENSRATRWKDPRYPAEIIQLGAVGVERREGTILFQQAHYVKPRVNPVLSDYCRELLGIDQEIINRAQNYGEMSNQLRYYLEAEFSAQSVVTCSWGMDRPYIRQNALINEDIDPFEGMGHMNLEEEAIQLLGLDRKRVEREEVRDVLSVDQGSHNHDALSDAIDVMNIYNHLNKRIAGGTNVSLS